MSQEKMQNEYVQINTEGQISAQRLLNQGVVSEVICLINTLKNSYYNMSYPSQLF